MESHRVPLPSSLLPAASWQAKRGPSARYCGIQLSSMFNLEQLQLTQRCSKVSGWSACMALCPTYDLLPFLLQCVFSSLFDFLLVNVNISFFASTHARHCTRIYYKLRNHKSPRIVDIDVASAITKQYDKLVTTNIANTFPPTRYVAQVAQIVKAICYFDVFEVRNSKTTNPSPHCCATQLPSSSGHATAFLMASSRPRAN